MSPRTAVLGGVAYVSCILLIVTGYLVSMMSSPVEGSVSQGEKIGSMIMDVGTFGIHATSCLVFIPTFAWREVQSYRRRSLLRYIYVDSPTLHPLPSSPCVYSVSHMIISINMEYCYILNQYC